MDVDDATVDLFVQEAEFLVAFLVWHVDEPGALRARALGVPAVAARLQVIFQIVRRASRPDAPTRVARAFQQSRHAALAASGERAREEFDACVAIMHGAMLLVEE